MFCIARSIKLDWCFSGVENVSNRVKIINTVDLLMMDQSDGTEAITLDGFFGVEQ